jgi:flagellar biosynthesis/type III secretory pathway chaperone
LASDSWNLSVTTSITSVSPSPIDLEAEIGALLDELTSVQGDLLGVLNEKRTALATADLPKLAELHPRAARLAARLAECQDRRAALLAAARREGLPSDNVAKLATRARGGKSNKLGSRVKETAARMRILQHHSLANWVLAQRSLLHVSQLVEIIATGGRMQPTYGDSESVHARGSLVNQEA